MVSPAHHARGIMLVVAVVDVTPPKLVQVLVDDTWYPGELRAWQKLDGRWRGDVTPR